MVTIWKNNYISFWNCWINNRIYIYFNFKIFSVKIKVLVWNYIEKTIVIETYSLTNLLLALSNLTMLGYKPAIKAAFTQAKLFEFVFKKLKFTIFCWFAK